MEPGHEVLPAGDEGDGPKGAWFTGRARPAPVGDPLPGRGGRPLPSSSAARGPGGLYVRARPCGTRLTESWEMLPGVERFGQRFGDGAAAQVHDRYLTAQRGIAASGDQAGR